MKTALSLTELAGELDRQQKVKRDFVLSTQALHSEGGCSNLHLTNAYGDFGVSNHVQRQVGEHLHIPAKYFDYLKADHPGLLDTTVNTLFAERQSRRMVRTLDGNVRAFLSDQYRCFDNFDLAETVLPILMKQPDMRVESCAVTESRMYIKAVFPKISRPDPGVRRKGEVINAGVVISNSEIGSGSVRIEPLLYFLACLNGMIGSTALRRNHVGKQIDAHGEIYTTETKIADDRAFYLKVRDTVTAACDEAAFNSQVEKVFESTENKIDKPVDLFVEEIQSKYQLTEGERGSVLNALIAGGDLTQYGLMQAVTNISQSVEDYDRATDLERMGGQIIELDRNDWMALAA